MGHKPPPDATTRELGIENLATSVDERSTRSDAGQVVQVGQVGMTKWLILTLIAIVSVALIVGWLGNDRTPDPTTVPQVPATAPPSVDSLIGQHQLAYVSNDGVTIVNPASLQEPVRTVAPEYTTISHLIDGFGTLVMVDPRGATYGIRLGNDLEDLTVYNLSSQWQISFGENNLIAHAFGLSQGPSHIYVGPPSGVFVTRLEVPTGAAILAAPFLGVLIVGASNETLIATRSSFAHFSDWPVLAASANHHVEARCVETPICSLVVVDRATGNVSEVPTESTGEVGNVMISPDGNYLLLLDSSKGTGNTDFLFDVAASELVALNETIPSVVAWSPDSSLVGWFDPITSEPRLWVLDVNTANIASVDLAAMGAPSRIGQSLLLLP